MSRSYSRLNWRIFLQTLFKDTGVVIRVDEQVVVSELEYVQKLVKLIDTTPIRVIGKLKNTTVVDKLRG